jgi:hypothetical protein
MFSLFLKIASIATIGVWVLLGLPLYFFGSAPILGGALIGCVLPALGFIAGFYAVCWALHRAVRPFLIAVLGGVFLRFVVIGLTFVFLMRATNIHVYSFVFSLVGFYSLYMAIELYLLHNNQQRLEGSYT